MKKTLLSMAFLGAFSLAAQAGQVSMYGAVDGGFVFSHGKYFAKYAGGGSESIVVGPDGKSLASNEVVLLTNHQQKGSDSSNKASVTKNLEKKHNSFKLGDGLLGANKIGIKGTEEVGSSVVGFQLENGFNLADGSFNDKNRLFDREARLFVRGSYGEVSVGRFGGLASAAGTYDIFFKNADAFDGGDNDVKYAFVHSDRMDNSIAYQTPEVMGLQGTVMYSFNKKGEQQDKMRENNRYAGLGLTYHHDALTLVGVVEAQLRAKQDKGPARKDGMTWNLGGNYAFGFGTVYTGFQYAHHSDFGEISQGFTFENLVDEFGPANDEERDTATTALNRNQFDGYAFSLGMQVPFGRSKVTLGTYYSHFKNAFKIGKNVAMVKDDPLPANVFNNDVPAKAAKLTVYGVAGRYEYALSPRSTLFAAVGYGQSKLKAPENTFKYNVVQGYFGLHHIF